MTSFSLLCFHSFEIFRHVVCNAILILISEPNCERVSRICDVDIYIYIHTLVYIYIFAFRFYVILYVFLCALCGVRNKLRVSCKETRFYFCTQPHGFCFVFVF